MSNRNALSAALGIAALCFVFRPALQAQSQISGPAVPAAPLPFLSPAIPTSSSAQSAAADLPFNGVVRAVARNGTDVYVAGDFTSIGTNPISFVARWDGSTWQPLGDPDEGIDGQVRSIVVDGEKVYVGGSFTRIGSVITRNIAVWNRATNRWSGMGGGVGGTLRNGVNAIALYDGQLYVAGSFIAAGTIVAANIARWDGRRWYRVGTGINNTVHSLYVDSDYLYAGGSFTVAGGVRSGGIARYHAGTGRWESAGIAVEGNVKAIAADANYLYVGGVFDSIDGRFAQNIVRIDKASGEWSPMHKGLQGYNYIAGGLPVVKGVETILVHETGIYVGGTLTQTYTQRPNGEFLIGLAGLAKWNGEYWLNLAYTPSHIQEPNATPPGARKNAPAPPNIYALAADADGTIMIGGDFDYVTGSAGKVLSPYLGRFRIADSSFGFFSTGATRGEDPPVATSLGSSSESDSDRNGRRVPRFDLLGLTSGASGNSATSESGETLYNTVPLPDDAYWRSVESYVANDNGVLAVAADENEIYAGGTFTHLYGIEANGIAVRRNREWSALDDGMAVGVNGFVYAIAVSGSKVYVGGQFTKAGGVSANNIAVWDRVTKTWSALGGGITGPGTNPPFVSAILVRGNDVYAGGNFTTAGGSEASNIARWSGGAWSSLGNGIDGPVNALEFFRDNLYAGGSFTRAGAINSSAIAWWDGANWNAMQGGLNGFVNDITMYVTERDTAIAIGGEFRRNMQPDPDSPAVYAENLIWWNDGGWYAKTTLAPSEPGFVRVNGEVRDLLMVGFDLYVAGAFSDAVPRGTGQMGGRLRNVAFFNEWVFQGQPIPMWHAVGGGLQGNVNALALSGDEVIAGGDFTRVGGSDLSADHVAIWSIGEQEWIWAGNPTALAPVEVMTIHDNTLYASGSFVSQELGLFEVTNYLVRLTGLGWKIVEGQLRGTGYALASATDQELVLGGAMISSDDRITVNVSRWNSGTGEWGALTPGSGVASLEDISFVSAIASDGESVYVGGDFDIADSLPVNNVACWNRSTNAWRRLGNGLNGTVLALAVDANGTLYAGGSFNKSGTTDVDHIARWDGTNWQPLGFGLNGNVYTIAIADGALYAGGTFTVAGSEAAASVARWDIASGTWSPLGEGLTAGFEPSVNALAVSRGRLFAAGRFETSGQDTVRNIARWNPTGGWEPLGSGTDRLINTLAISRTGAVYAGGYFLTAGCKELNYVALWQDPTLSVQPLPVDEPNLMLTAGAPNPFTASATVRLSLPAGARHNVLLELYDATGRKLRTILDGTLSPGDHVVPIDGDDLATGAYVIRMRAGERIESVRVVKW